MYPVLSIGNQGRFSFFFATFGNRVISTVSQRVTTANSPGRHEAAGQCPVPAYRFGRILRTRRGESAAAAASKQKDLRRRDYPAIKLDKKQQYCARPQPSNGEKHRLASGAATDRANCMVSAKSHSLKVLPAAALSKNLFRRPQASFPQSNCGPPKSIQWAC